MSDSIPLNHAVNRSSETVRLGLLHSIEAVVSMASNLLTIGVFFFMQHRFGWGLKRNFLLSAGLGAVYIFGALGAHRISTTLGRRGGLAAAYGAIILATLAVALHTTPAVATLTILLFAFCSATTWPVIENLVSEGASDPHVLSRRLAVYNIVWAITGAGIIAVNGLIIETWSIGVFLIPTGVCLIALLIAVLAPIIPRDEPAHAASHAPPLPPEPKLAQQRIVALWLSRICVPAMYLMIYALAAMLPSLPLLQPMRPAMQTLLSSVWMVARFLMFLFLGATVFWHTKPRLLLLAAAMLLISLIMITVRPTDIGMNASNTMNLSVMIAGQIAFGAATGLIYTASLYFGMVLSEGSTEHGGYHEALIGLGMALGPAMGALSQWLFPGSQFAAVSFVGTLIGISILLASVASLRMRRKRE